MLSLLLLCGLTAVLGLQLHNAISKSLFESGVRATLRRHFDDGSRFHLIDVRFTRDRRATLVRAVIRGPKPPSTEEVAAAQSDLPTPPDGTPLKLRVRFVEVVIVTPQGLIIGGDQGDP